MSRGLGSVFIPRGLGILIRLLTLHSLPRPRPGQAGFPSVCLSQGRA